MSEKVPTAAAIGSANHMESVMLNLLIPVSDAYTSIQTELCRDRHPTFNLKDPKWKAVKTYMERKFTVNNMTYERTRVMECTSTSKAALKRKREFVEEEKTAKADLEVGKIDLLVALDKQQETDVDAVLDEWMASKRAECDRLVGLLQRVEESLKYF